ncbi:flagellar hook-length control protein FliK [Legionella brunensis]|uniref:Flagellar hook-length control protein FliK n=1 Tax=Legionella brunensis TaxID=29422 RepID=A0A0W0RZV2_9GAMM|nr:flagellar hook-length control protein FliK [Legionella brunensis]KTC76748.1 Flagellar hook-length control protein FliK [Legionella brunensis]
MAVDMSNSTPIVRLEPMQELKLTKAATELYVGQILKTVVVKALSENQVLININGQNINARTSHHVDPGELLQVKVLQTAGETILQVLRSPPQSNPLHTALMQILPHQASPTYLLSSLSGLATLPNLPAGIHRQIQQLLVSISPLTQLPQQLGQAINYSGIFWENTLLHWRKESSRELLNLDFKGQCLRLFNLLNEQLPALPRLANSTTPYEPDKLPLPGSIPQPLRGLPTLSYAGQTIEHILAMLYEHTGKTIARIETNQLLHLLSPPDEPYSVMLELPIKTLTGLEVIPLKIEEQRKQNTTTVSSWSISFAAHFNNLGDIQAKVTLQDKTIDIQIHTDKAETVEFLSDNQQTFGELLQELELTLSSWNVHLGLLTEEEIDTSNLRLLDIRI